MSSGNTKTPPGSPLRVIKRGGATPSIYKGASTPEVARYRTQASISSSSSSSTTTTQQAEKISNPQILERTKKFLELYPTLMLSNNNNNSYFATSSLSLSTLDISKSEDDSLITSNPSHSVSLPSFSVSSPIPNTSPAYSSSPLFESSPPHSPSHSPRSSLKLVRIPSPRSPSASPPIVLPPPPPPLTSSSSSSIISSSSPTLFPLPPPPLTVPSTPPPSPTPSRLTTSTSLPPSSSSSSSTSSSSPSSSPRPSHHALLATLSTSSPPLIMRSSSSLAGSMPIQCTAEDEERMLQYLLDILPLAFPQVQVSGTRVTGDTSLANLGLASSEVVQFKNTISSELHTSIPTTLLFDCATLGELAKRVAHTFLQKREEVRQAELDNAPLSALAQFHAVRCSAKGFSAISSFTLKIPAEGAVEEASIKKLVAEKSLLEVPSFDLIDSELLVPLSFPYPSVEVLPSNLFIVPVQWNQPPELSACSEEFVANLGKKEVAAHTKKLLSKVKKQPNNPKLFFDYLCLCLPVLFPDQDLAKEKLTPDYKVGFFFSFEELSELRTFLFSELQTPFPFIFFSESKTLMALAERICQFYHRRK